MNLLVRLNEDGHFEVYQFDTPQQQYDTLRKIIADLHCTLSAYHWNEVREYINEGFVHQAIDHLDDVADEFCTGRGVLELVKLNDGGWATFLKPEPSLAIPPLTI